MIKGQKLNTEEAIELIDEFDLFAYKDIRLDAGPQKVTNVLIEGLNNGYMNLLNYCLEEGPLNVRSCLRTKNKFEILEETSQSYTRLFLVPKKKLLLFKQIYTHLVDILQLRNFIEVFEEVERNLDVALFLLKDAKFQSLFISSLEMQKYVFLGSLIAATSDNEKVTAILQEAPYQKYYKDI
mmetsp:Transcript_40850/g.30064  ORF Transcript_40850/g.30064 Transcript_40850/m.30064 type:complete len:182 (+) Transcript_40850:234-779(+)|eukprot:CAMPEP_0202968916 /NCGR_PEP_ID=MMETSP1396-20130829/14435_1 /ASSEMBLY_ACC=CAM_ASM_000872 /TAXON_ID= /ORGANISM="Pseudokeronopsis sp., Strain Brazil" /LENGTH=181 /DNA_ID=CAMNT_0049695827 /DNA_START=223 /DNA_END=768 /DNA_ORIENTATION=+